MTSPAGSSFRFLIGDTALSGPITATTQGGAIDVPGGAADVLVMVHASAVTGTTPSMTVTLEQSADGATGWATVTGSATAALTAAGNVTANATVTSRFVRAVATVTGTTPSFTARVALVAFAA